MPIVFPLERLKDYCNATKDILPPGEAKDVSVPGGEKIGELFE